MKRMFDLGLAAIVLLATAPIMIVIALLIRLRDGPGVFYVAERMKTPDVPFNLIKFRTMSHAAPDANTGVTGGDKAARITAIGKTLRRYRLDELPQVFNVIRGDMSFVGPRPPLRQYTAAFPEIYGPVLQSKPGITGLATLYFHKHEDWLIRGAKTPSETEAIYTQRCIPRKAALDLLYARNASLCFDIVILWRTLRRVIT